MSPTNLSRRDWLKCCGTFGFLQPRASCTAVPNVGRVTNRFMARGISPEIEETLQRLIPSLRVVEMLDNRHAAEFFGSFAYKKRASQLVNSKSLSFLPREDIPVHFQEMAVQCLKSCAFYLPKDPSEFATDQGIEAWASRYIDEQDSSWNGDRDLEVRQGFGHIMSLKRHLLRKEITLDKLKEALLGEHIDIKGLIDTRKKRSEKNIEDLIIENSIKEMKARLKELQPNPTLSQFLEVLWGFGRKSAFIKAIRPLDTGMIDLHTFMTQFRENKIATIVDVVKTHGLKIRQAYADMKLVRAGKPLSETDLHADVEPVDHGSANPNHSYPSIYTAGANPSGNLYNPPTLNTYSGSIARARIGWERR